MTVTVERDGRVAHVRLSCPPPHHTIDLRTLGEIVTAYHTLTDPGRGHEPASVIVLSGDGPSFCQGGDIGELVTLASGDDGPDDVRRAAALGHRVCRAIAESPAVTVARLHGPVAGTGVCLAAHCDLRVGADTATFRLPELALGIPPAWGGTAARLAMDIGLSRLRHLVLTCDAIDAPTALEYGLLHQVVPEEELTRATGVLARKLARRHPGGVRIAKAMLRSMENGYRQGDLTHLDSELFAHGLLHR
ncbi:enoyl-CoA hydratase/isomerase family protein [Herbidospora cretacea]|uniref:enoyl-CoA hydratase/isomerase family protein n=1 Tax=Herbidospora cretacea TaxID=28444 RepID=UPI000774E58E|nr:enoyl-CoA hydratase/isomerase family protein [Herbidospora cretacea]